MDFSPNAPARGSRLAASAPGLPARLGLQQLVAAQRAVPQREAQRGAGHRVHRRRLRSIDSKRSAERIRAEKRRKNAGSRWSVWEVHGKTGKWKEVGAFGESMGVQLMEQQPGTAVDSQQSVKSSDCLEKIDLPPL